MLTSFDRAAALERLGRETFDVVVVGGGVTGAGVALDAAARGLRTALVDAGDLACGTSSQSSKLVHGGLRYLSGREYRLVAEALAERQRLLRNAPHLVRPLPFLIPLFGRAGHPGADPVVAHGVARAYSVALSLYDVCGGLRIGHRHRRITAAEAVAHVPSLGGDRLAASFLYWDAQADDARLTLAIARTAAVTYGATVATYAPVVGLRRGRGGRVVGVDLADGTGIRASVVVNAAGVWSEQVATLAGDTGLRLRPAKGVHVTVSADRLPCDVATVLPVPGSRASVFVVPWDAAGASAAGGAGRFTYIGTTDTDYDGPLDDPRCSAADVETLLGAVNARTSAHLTPADVTGAWAGLRPLVADDGDTRTADLSRRHRVTTSDTGVVTVTGGKLTTYRQMAAETTDAVGHLLGHRLTYAPTRRLALWGAEGSAALGEPAAPGRLGLEPAVLGHLVRRYGGEARTIAALCADDPDLARPLVTGLPYLRAEAVFAARHEMTHRLLDVLTRRTRAALLDTRATMAAAPEVAELVGRELGWSAAERRAQVDGAVTALATVLPGPDPAPVDGPACGGVEVSTGAGGVPAAPLVTG